MSESGMRSIGPQRGTNRSSLTLDLLLLALLIADGALGVSVPSPGREFDKSGAISVTLALLVFTTGMSLNFSDFGSLRNRWRRIVTILALSTLTSLALARAASYLVAGPLRGGVLAVGLAPTEVASMALAGMAGGEVAIAGMLLVASSLITVVIAGPVLIFLATVPTIGGKGLLGDLVLIVALPLLAGMIVRRLGILGQNGLAISRTLSSVVLLVLFWEVASQVILKASYGLVVLALASMILGAGIVGWLLGKGLDVPTRRAILLSVTMRDFAVASGIAAIAFGPGATGVLGVYGLIILILGTGYSLLVRVL
ncbi:MAG: hypothetical protein M1288_04455 [Actinobacteria bacterium]|nr:hypothetical protein [Actinomycetota bacterium]